MGVKLKTNLGTLYPINAEEAFLSLPSGRTAVFDTEYYDKWDSYIGVKKNSLLGILEKEPVGKVDKSLLDLPTKDEYRVLLSLSAEARRKSEEIDVIDFFENIVDDLRDSGMLRIDE